MTGLLVLVSVATAKAIYEVKVGLLMCYSPFLFLYQKTPRFFEKLVLKQKKYCFVTTIPSLLLIDCFIKQYHGATSKETKCRGKGCLYQ